MPTLTRSKATPSEPTQVSPPTRDALEAECRVAARAFAEHPTADLEARLVALEAALARCERDERRARWVTEARAATAEADREAVYQALLAEARTMVADLERTWIAARAVVQESGLPAREDVEAAVLAGAAWGSAAHNFYAVTDRAEFNVFWDLRSALGAGEVSPERVRIWRVWLQEQSRAREKPSLVEHLRVAKEARA